MPPKRAEAKAKESLTEPTGYKINDAVVSLSTRGFQIYKSSPELAGYLFIYFILFYFFFVESCLKAGNAALGSLK